MIFITLGSQKFQFNRLLKSVDDLIDQGIIQEAVFAQIGYSDYKPLHYDYQPFLDREKFIEMEELAELVITHGGTGAIIGAVKKGKKVIAIPRLKKYGEHVDDHQLQLIRQFADSNLISSCENLEYLKDVYMETKTKEFHVYESGTANYLENIEKFIKHL